MSGPFLTSSEEVVASNDRAGPRLIATFVIALGLQPSVIAKADDPHLGIIEYEISCLPCHGISGRGDGPRAKTLKTVPADLTQIAKHNKGEFPYEKVADMIDGRATVSAHGQREMPVWGDRYRASAQTNERSISISWTFSSARPKVTSREDGSFLIDAFIPFSDVMQLIGMNEAPSGDYVTLAGFVLSQLHELPKAGDHFVWGGWCFEVVDMDGRRIDTILVQQ